MEEDKEEKSASSHPPQAGHAPQTADVAEKREQTELRIRNAYGAPAAVPSECVAFMDDENLVYPIGKHLCKVNLETKQQEFPFPKKLNSHIVCVAACPALNLLVICESGGHNKNAQVTVVCTKPRKVLWTFFHPSKKGVVSCTISSNAKVIAVLGCAPTYTLAIWKLETHQLMLAKDLKTPISRMTINPQDNALFCASGRHYIRLLRRLRNSLDVTTLLPPSAEANSSFVDHVWVATEYLVSVTDTDKVLVFHSQQLLQTIQLPPSTRPTTSAMPPKSARDTLELPQTPAIPSAPTTPDTSRKSSVPRACIQTWRRGFVVGRSDCHLCLYQMDSKSMVKQFVPYREFDCHMVQPLISLCTSPNNQLLVCCFEKGHMLKFPIGHVESFNEEDMAFENLVNNGTHSGPITWLDACIQKSLLVTVGADSTVRVLDAHAHTCLSSTHFPASPPLCAALHPQGFVMLVSFKEHIDVYHILRNSLKKSYELPIKDASVVRYSNGGHMFACVTGSTVTVYDANKFVPIVSISSHRKPVSSMRFSNDDMLIGSVSHDGNIYVHQLPDGKQISNCALKNIAENDVLVRVSDGHHAVAGCAPGVPLHQLSATDVPEEKGQPGQFLIMEFLAAKNALLVGTAEGELQVYSWPLTNDAKPFAWHTLHDGPITALRVNEATGLIYTAGQDGVLLTLSLSSVIPEEAPTSPAVVAGKTGKALTEKEKDKDKEREREREKEKEKTVSTVISSDEEELGAVAGGMYIGDPEVELVLVAEVDELQNKLSNMEREVLMAKNEASEKVNSVKTFYEAKLDSMRQQGKSDELEAQAALQGLKMQAMQKQSTVDTSINEMKQKHKKEVEDLVLGYQAKLSEEYERFDKHAQAHKQAEQQFQQQLAQVQQEHAKAQAALKAEGETTAAKLQAEIAQLQQRLKDQEKAYEEALDEMEMEQTAQASQLKQAAADADSSRKDALSQASNELRFALNRHDQSNKTIVLLRARLDDVEKERGVLLSRVSALEAEYAASQQQVREREHEITLRQRELARVRASINNKDNFKVVLDNRIKELEEREDPARSYIDMLQERIKQMEKEMDEVHALEYRIKLESAEAKNRVEQSQRTVASLKEELQAERSRLSAVVKDLTEVVLDVPQECWVEQLVNLYNKHIGKNNPLRTRVRGQTGFLTQEGLKAHAKDLERQRLHLQKNVAQTEELLSQEQKAREDDMRKLRADNTFLTDECNWLRKEVKRLDNVIAKMESDRLCVNSMTRINMVRAASASTLPQVTSPPQQVPQSAPGSLPRSDITLHMAAARQMSPARAARAASPGKKLKAGIQQAEMLATAAKARTEAGELRAALEESRKENELLRLQVSKLQAGLQAALTGDPQRADAGMEIMVQQMARTLQSMPSLPGSPGQRSRSAMQRLPPSQTDSSDSGQSAERRDSQSVIMPSGKTASGSGSPPGSPTALPPHKHTSSSSSSSSASSSASAPSSSSSSSSLSSAQTSAPSTS